MKCLIPKPFDAGDLARSTLLCDRHMDPTFFFLDTAPLLATPTVQSHSPRLLRCYSEEISCMERSLGCEATFKNIPYRFISRCLEMFHRSCFLLLLLFFLSLSLLMLSACTLLFVLHESRLKFSVNWEKFILFLTCNVRSNNKLNIIALF